MTSFNAEGKKKTLLKGAFWLHMTDTFQKSEVDILEDSRRGEQTKEISKPNACTSSLKY